MVTYKDLSRKSTSNIIGVETRRMLVGIETKLVEVEKNVIDFFEEWGELYQKIVRWSAKRLLWGLTKNELQQLIQSLFDVDWAWADSAITDAIAAIDAAKELRKLNILNIEADLKSGIERVEEMVGEYNQLIKEGKLQLAKTKKFYINNKLNRLITKAERLIFLKKSQISITFGTKELARKQNFLSENGYKNHEAWLKDWREARSGNFQSIGKADASGKNKVMKTYHVKDNIFRLKITVPKCLVKKYSSCLTLDFTVPQRRLNDLLYAVDPNNVLSHVSKQPITVRCFRREHKNHSWYLHFSTYVPEIPTVSHNNGTLAIDLNAKSIDIVYVKKDGNLKKQVIKSYSIPVGSTGQVEALLRDLVNEIVKLAIKYSCSISIENLDFSQKKATLRHSRSKKYNRMLSGFIYSKFRELLVVACEKKGVYIKLINPEFTSTIGLFKYAKVYGLSSGFAAAFVIGRRSLGYKEKINGQARIILNNIHSNKNKTKASKNATKSSSNNQKVVKIKNNWRLWRKIHNKMRACKIARSQFYQANVSTVIEYATKLVPSSRHAGNTSVSGSRVHKLYSVCNIAIGCTFAARRNVSAPASEIPT